MLTVVVTFSVVWFAVALSSHSEYAALDGSINSAIASGSNSPDTALNNALYVVQRNNYDLTLDVVFPSGVVTRLNTTAKPLRRHPTLADVKDSLEHITSEPNLPGFLIRSISAGGGDYLVVAGSTENIKSSNQHLALKVALVALIITLLGLVLARQVIRRDLRSMERLIDYAGDVTKGDEVGPVPPSEGSRDLKELRAAVVFTVNALQRRIDAEASSAAAMQQFIDDASHELRTPLTVIKGYNEILASGTTSSDQQTRAVSRIKHEVTRMEALVNDLLLLAEVRESPAHVNRSFNVAELVRDSVVDFSLGQSERVVTSEIQERVTMHAREEFVERLVVNALTNIARHTPLNAPVKISLNCDDDDVLLLIEDGGPGLPSYGVRPQRFQRFDESRSRDTGGSGLGMSIMADVAEALGGTMVTEKSELGGLAVRFVLPRTMSETTS
jgi:signal transduction histidine kinase